MALWSPRFATHVVGAYVDEPEEGDEGKPVWPWRAACRICREEHRGVCTSGEMRARIVDFAMLHLHSDPLERSPAPGDPSYKVLPPGDDER